MEKSPSWRRVSPLSARADAFARAVSREIRRPVQQRIAVRYVRETGLGHLGVMRRSNTLRRGTRCCGWRPQLIGVVAFTVAMALGARAQSASPDTTQRGTQDTTVVSPGKRRRPAQLDTVATRGRLTDLVGTATSANQGVVGVGDLARRPLLRPGDVVENVPGVIVTQHSGSGKANQYFLRGFNLDHGTDLALSVDNVPVNMPTHAHGQGYADLNFLIPELIERVDFKKGPYYADVGDFGSAGAFNVRYYDRLRSGLVRADGGQFGYGRLVAANNAPVGDGNLIYAGELEHNDGPWTIGDNERKVDVVLRYARGDATHGVVVTAMGYHNGWRSTDQVPDRAIAEHLIGRWGRIDSTDAGATGRYALSADWHAIGARAASHVVGYALQYNLNLFSNFSYFLTDPVHGDQIEQHDTRWVFGGEASHTVFGRLFSVQSQSTIGVQLRDYNIDNGLYNTEARVRLGTVTVNRITEPSAAPFVENRTYWTDWLRTIVGVRGDFVWFDVHNISGGNSGAVHASLLSPKLGIIVGPWVKTEFYVNGGYGFHSNDARGVTSRIDAATALPRSMGAEIGARTAVIPGLESSVSVWLLDLKSELVWRGDAGGNAPSGPTRRYGVEIGTYYTPLPWLTIDADYAWSRARYTDHEAAGDFVPEALVATSDGGIAVHDLAGSLHRARGGLRLRYFGPRPLTQDDNIRSTATTLVYADLGYDLNSRWSVALVAFNLLNTRASDIDYYYASRLPGEPLSGVADIHTHPAEPRELRVSIAARL